MHSLFPILFLLFAIIFEEQLNLMNNTMLKCLHVSSPLLMNWFQIIVWFLNERSLYYYFWSFTWSEILLRRELVSVESIWLLNRLQV